MFAFAHLCCWYCPDFEVVGSHEEIGNTHTHHPHDPFVKVLWLRVGYSCLHCGIDHAIYAIHLLFLGQHGDVVLEWVGDPLVLAADVGHPLMCVPVVFFGQCLGNAVVEVLVV